MHTVVESFVWCSFFFLLLSVKMLASDVTSSLIYARKVTVAHNVFGFSHAQEERSSAQSFICWMSEFT